MLENKNNGNEEELDFKRRYLVGVLRMQANSFVAYERVEPYRYEFEHMRDKDTQLSYRDMLRDIEAGLALENSPRKIDFHVEDEYDDLDDLVDESSITLSPHAFCTAIVEMIPFSAADIIAPNTNPRKRHLLLFGTLVMRLMCFPPIFVVLSKCIRGRQVATGESNADHKQPSYCSARWYACAGLSPSLLFIYFSPVSKH
uniref:Uncharacterized protein n=1 Tax=Romanomermis culicivorax TaxID=13658 RepID=A0A915JV43_ROMCU